MRIAVIGGGPAGLSAAIRAASNGASVTLFEKTDRVGRKLLATGNGRCNLSNRDASLSHWHGSALPIAETVFERVTPETVLDFWNEIGISTVELEEGKLFPRSLQASAALDALRFEASRVGVQTELTAEVRKLVSQKTSWNLTTAEGKSYSFDRVILAAGGKASPKLGANGEGKKLAEALGLKCAALYPALCRLNSDKNSLRALMGFKCDAALSLYVNSELVQKEEGELLFTETGLSGPPILRLSREAGEALRRGGKAEISADLVPELSSGELFQQLSERFRNLKGRTVSEALIGFLHKKPLPVLLKEASLGLTVPADRLTKTEIGSLCHILKDWRFTITSTEGFDDAQVTLGGVKGEEIDEHLMAKRLPGLYFAGEVVDLDGDCGGYNLLWAVASGLYAGENASQQ